ncbi:MAG: ABC transporter permease [Haloferacaceae archaeon]
MTDACPDGGETADAGRDSFARQFPLDTDQLFAVVGRELRTVVRTRAYAALAVGYAALVVALAVTGGASGYLPLILDLLTYVEVLVPALAVAFGYRAVLGDARRGELDVLQTYPLSKTTFVLGVYLGRVTALLAVVLVPLLLVAALVPLVGGTQSSVLATHAGADSAFLYLRFLVLTALFSLVCLGVALAVSATADSVRAAVALGLGFLVVLVVGLDVGVVAALAAGVVGEGSLQWVLALSPNSAFRGLVLETVVGAVSSPSVRAAVPAANLVGLGIWLAGSLSLSIWAVWDE